MWATYRLLPQLSNFYYTFYIVKLSSEQSSEHSSKQSSNEAWQKQGEGEDLYENEEELTESFRNVSYPRACRSSASEKGRSMTEMYDYHKSV